MNQNKFMIPDGLATDGDYLMYLVNIKAKLVKRAEIKSTLNLKMIFIVIRYTP